MKRYMVFAYEHYDPHGGLEDVASSYDTLEEARECASSGYSDYVSIFDRLDGVEVS